MSARKKHKDVARGAFERYTGRPFPIATRAQLPWLGCFVLDGYNADLRIAFMCHGKYHYQPDPVYHAANEQAGFVKQLETDARKNYLCAAHGIIMITIPYTVPVAGYTGYVVNALEHLRSDTAADKSGALEHLQSDTAAGIHAPQNTTIGGHAEDGQGGPRRRRATPAALMCSLDTLFGDNV